MQVLAIAQSRVNASIHKFVTCFYGRLPYILRIAYKNMYSTGQHQSPWWEFSDFRFNPSILSVLSVFEVPQFSLVPTILLNIGSTPTLIQTRQMHMHVPLKPEHPPVKKHRNRLKNHHFEILSMITTFNFTFFCNSRMFPFGPQKGSL